MNLLWVLAAIVVAVLAAKGVGTAEATPVSTVLKLQVGQQTTMNAMLVVEVPADEGFWVDSDHGRIWVQIATTSESWYDVDVGDTVNFTGRVDGHGPDFPAQVGVTALEGSADLVTAGAHVTIPLDGLTFANGGGTA